MKVRQSKKKGNTRKSVLLRQNCHKSLCIKIPCINMQYILRMMKNLSFTQINLKCVATMPVIILTTYFCISRSVNILEITILIIFINKIVRPNPYFAMYGSCSNIYESKIDCVIFPCINITPENKVLL